MALHYDLFLSHNSKDKPAVREIAKALRARQLQVWVDEDDLVPGRDWQEALEKIIQTIKAAAVLVGRDGLGPWEDREMRGCLSEFVRRKLPVIPVLLPGAPGKPELPFFLRAFTWVDLRDGITDEGLDRLVWGITGEKAGTLVEPEPPSSDRWLQGRGASNRKGVAMGPLVMRLSDIEDVYRATGSKVIFFSEEPDWNVLSALRTGKVAGVVTASPSGPTGHVLLQANELGIPMVTGFSLPEAMGPGSSSILEIDARESSLLRNVTYSPEFITEAARRYVADARRNLEAQVRMPPPLLRFLLQGKGLPGTEEDFVAWARRWGSVEALARAALPLLARESFDFSRKVCTALCRDGAESEVQAYRWPVGRDNARRVLPQMAFWYREGTVPMLFEWARSDNLPLVKAACMAVGTLVLLAWDAAREVVERAFSHPELTIAKEAARVLPVLREVDPSYAADLERRCSRDPQLAPLARSHPWGLVGLNLASLPALLLGSVPSAFAEVEKATRLITRFTLVDQHLNLARNCIVENVIPLWEMDAPRTLHLLRELQPFLILDDVQIDLLVAWTWLRRRQPKEADQLFSLIDGRLNPEPYRVYREMIAFPVQDG